MQLRAKCSEATITEAGLETCVVEMIRPDEMEEFINKPPISDAQSGSLMFHEIIEAEWAEIMPPNTASAGQSIASGDSRQGASRTPHTTARARSTSPTRSTSGTIDAPNAQLDPFYAAGGRSQATFPVTQSTEVTMIDRDEGDAGAEMEVEMTGGGSGISNAGVHAEVPSNWASVEDPMDIDPEDFEMGGV